MTMTFSNSLGKQLDFDQSLGALSASSRSRRPNRTTRKRQALDDRQTSYSIMNRDNLLAIMQVPSISKLITKYTGARGLTSPRLPPVNSGGGGGGGGGGAGNRRIEVELEEERQFQLVRPEELEHEREHEHEQEVEEEEEIFHDATDAIAQLATDLTVTTSDNSPKSATIRGSNTQQQQSESTTSGTQKSSNNNNNNNTNLTSKPKGDAWQLECKYTMSEVQQHNSLDDCWMVIFDKVYDTTEFVHEHPGGDFILFEYAGRDATHAFLSSRHGSSAYKMLDKYWIGILVDEELYYSNNSSYCSVYLDLSWRSTPTLEEASERKERTSRVVSESESASNSATSPASSSSSLTSDE